MKGMISGDTNVLRDTTLSQNITSVTNRRMSLESSTAEDAKIRRQQLDEWRRQKRAAASQENCYDTSNSRVSEEFSKRPRSDIAESPIPPRIGLNLPPVIPTKDELCGNSVNGSSAFGRLVLKHQRPYTANDGTNLSTPQLPPQPPNSVIPKRSTICFDDDDDGPAPGSAVKVGATPRRYTISSGAKRISRGAGRRSIAPVFQEHVSCEDDTSKPPEPLGSNDNSKSQTLEDGPGIQSKILMMEKRIQELEQEKLSFTLGVPALKNQVRHLEDQIAKERIWYEKEISELNKKYMEIEDRCKSLKVENENLSEECSCLRSEAVRQRTETVLNQSEEEEIWRKPLRNDRLVASLKDKLKNAEDEIKDLRLQKCSVESESEVATREHAALLRAYDTLLVDYNELSARKESNIEAEIQLQELTKEHVATTAQLNATCGELASLTSQYSFEIDLVKKEWAEEKEKLLFELSVQKSRNDTLSRSNSRTIDCDGEDKAILRARIEEKDRQIAEFKADLANADKIRKMLHNRIQELRGNIRVYVRTRPFLPGDGDCRMSSIDILPDGESLTICDPRNGEPVKFTMDKVFPASSGQEYVFNEVADFVQSALDGYNVCLFSYGQTGSGKTHTMQGSGNGAMRGIIPRAVEQILSQIKILRNQGWTYEMSASFLEIYNEDLRDLLSSMSEGAKTDSKLVLRRPPKEKIYVEGLTEVAIDTGDFDAGMNKLKALMISASRGRKVAKTKMNEVSSRSHSVFMLHLRGVKEDDGTVVRGTLNLCDLAGSERLDRSGVIADPARLKETKCINNSLSCLGDVFNALAQGSSHIPFRNSLLTSLLQDCLSGDGKALMFVNVSPTQDSASESLCSLRFAQRVNQVELGKANKHIQYGKSSSKK